MTISGFVAYIKQAWKNKPDTSTPLSADRLTHIEDGIKGNSDAIAKIAAAVVNQIVNDPNKIASMAALFAVNQKVTSLNANYEQLNTDLGKAKYVSNILDPQEAPLFVRWDSNTLNTPYKSGQTTSSQGFALCYGELDKLQTAIAWAKGDYNVYVLNGVSGTTSGWKKLALRDDLPGRIYWGGTETINITTAGQFATGNKKITIPAGTYIIMGHATIPEGVNTTGRIKLDINALYETQQSWYPSQYAIEVNITTFKYFSVQTDITLSVRADKLITGITTEVAAIRIN